MLTSGGCNQTEATNALLGYFTSIAPRPLKKKPTQNPHNLKGKYGNMQPAGRGDPTEARNEICNTVRLFLTAVHYAFSSTGDTSREPLLR